MIAGGYSMDLYCRNESDCKRYPAIKAGLRPSVVQYFGETAAECRKQARKEGWRFKDRDCECSDCVAANGLS